MDDFKITLDSADLAYICQNQNKAILTAIAAVNFGLTDVAKVYNLNDNCLIYEIAA